ncbi:MAG: RNase adapter RapZ [Thermodesulfobacteriota bacterium]|nr:RNase adapter RapZ [Thermodesulfobacteriota bacterium]
MLKPVQVVIITGLSGSGKSTALRAFEDLGYYCVDNLPVVLLPQFLHIQEPAPGQTVRAALVMDMREQDFLKEYTAIFADLKKEGFKLEILFLESSDDVLLRRFSQTRRHHPLIPSPVTTVMDAIALERRQLALLKEEADRVLDTSFYNLHQLRGAIGSLYGSRVDLNRLLVNLLSFGFKYGVPGEADMVFDVRFLPNPFFVPNLKELDGTSPQAKDYVLKDQTTQTFLSKVSELLFFLIPFFKREGKMYLTIATGCTGGRHRSVTVTEELKNILTEKGYEVVVHHRDILLG